MHFRPPSRFRLLLPVGLLLALGACTIETEQPNIQGTTIRLTVIRTSDIHSRIFPYDLKPGTIDIGYGLYTETAPYGGAERLAALIQRERTRGDRVLYLDSGDPFQGAPIFNYTSGEPEFRWLSTVPVDAMVLGNHEFDLGAANLTTQAFRWVKYPLVVANYIFDDWTDPRNVQLGRYINPFVILNVHGLRVGLIGLGDVSSMYSIVEGGNSLGVTPVESNETARAYIALVSPAVDLIIIMSHLGLTEDLELVNGHALYLTDDKDVSAFLDRPEDKWIKMAGPTACPECQAGVVKYWIPGVRGIDAILGGHLHILLHPPMILTDPAGRKVLLEHPGAFAKYLTRIDMAVAVPANSYTCNTAKQHCTPEDTFGLNAACSSDADCDLAKVAPYGAEIIGNQHALFPIDSIWCAEPRPPDPYDSMFPQWVKTLTAYCNTKGNGPTRNLLEPYRIAMETDPRFELIRVYGYAPKNVERKNLGTGGDSPLGNMTALSMMRRKRVEAEFGVTNTLGIRDNLYTGLINMETIFNVFPFENTITVMYLAGREVQELFDYVTERSGDRGCLSQAQIAGASFVMNCGQYLRNQQHYLCNAPEDCCQYRPEIKPCDPNYQGSATWECTLGNCYSHPAEDIKMNGEALNLDTSYKLATNDYIANGGSGFKVLKRNTTKVFTGISMRDALVEYLTLLPNCQQLLASDPNTVDTFALSYCMGAQSNPGGILVKGNCTCKDALAGDVVLCNAITFPMLQFCSDPLKFPVIVGHEDGRIAVKLR